MIATDAPITTDAEAWDVVVDSLESTRDDPVEFGRLFLPGHGVPWSRQVEILRSVVRFKTTAVYSGNMVGKSWSIALLILWWLLTRPGSLVIVTGASQTTIGSIAWKEVRRALDGADVPFGGRLSQGIKASPAVVEIAPGWQALGFATTGVERASGQHAAELLVIVDEASGVEDEIWQGIDSLGAAKLVVYFNPIRSDGHAVSLVRQADKDRAAGIPDAEAVNAIQVPSTDSPHAAWDKSPWGLADRPWIEGMIRKYGINSLWVRSHIKAEIPLASAEILIPENWLDYLLSLPALDRPPGHPIHATRRISCDLSEGVGRDSTCVMVRDDWGILDCTVSSGLGLPEAAALIWRKSTQWGVEARRVSYDRGGLGKNMPNHLFRYGLQDACPYIGAGSAHDEESYVNLRTEAAFKARNRLDMTWFVQQTRPEPWDVGLRPQVPFGFAPGDYIERLREDLRPLTYSLVKKQSKLLNKDDHAAALGRSPDVFDTFCQSFAF